jgi:type I restriction enzyme R subunit
VLVSLFNTRLKILGHHLPDISAPSAAQAIVDLRAMLQRIPKDSFPVRKVWPEIQTAWEEAFWTHITPTKIEFLRLKVGPLLRFAAAVDVAAETFTSKVERLKLQMLLGSPSPDLLQSIAGDVSLLPDINERVQSGSIAKLAISQDLATATPQQLTQLVKELAPQMRNRRNRPSAFLSIDLPDFIETRGLISIGEGGLQIHVEAYKKKIEGRILALAEKNPALAALREGREATEEQLIELERTLHRELGAADLDLNRANIRRAYGLKVDNFLAFVRHLLAIDSIPDYGQVVRRAFERHIAAHHYSADQIRFLRAVQEVFLNKRSLTEADLYDPPLSIFGDNAVERYFSTQEISELLKLTAALAA